VNSLAKDKILVNSFSTSTEESAAVAPYRWGSGSDAEAAAASSAEVIGKQLVGKKAQYGGDDVKDTTRKFGLVQVEDLIDVDTFQTNLQKWGGKTATLDAQAVATYPGTGGAQGDAAIANQSAPTIVQRMKAAGVTTVILFADRAMNQALMEQAAQQGWTPEWFYTGSGYSDLPVLSQGTPDGQAHDSAGWARMVDDWARGGVARVVFAVGGAGGLAPAVLDVAERRVSLGPHTLSHELAQVVLCEQLYRAWTILRGEPYHK